MFFLFNTVVLSGPPHALSHWGGKIFQKRAISRPFEATQFRAKSKVKSKLTIYIYIYIYIYHIYHMYIYIYIIYIICIFIYTIKCWVSTELHLWFGAWIPLPCYQHFWYLLFHWKAKFIFETKQACCFN